MILSSPPMRSTVVKIAVDEGANVVAVDLLFVLEAMKMEQPIAAHKSGHIKNISATVRDTVRGGSVLGSIFSDDANCS